MAHSVAPLLASLHQAASEPVGWSHFVTTLLGPTQADAAFVIALSDDSTPAVYSDVGFTEQSHKSYREHYYRHDIILNRFREAGKKHGSWIGSRQSLLPDRVMERSEFYNDYMRPAGHYHQAGANLGRVGEYSLAGVTLVRDRGAGEFGDEVVELLRQLAPEIARWLLVHSEMAALRRENLLMRSAVDATGVACVGVDAAGRVQGCTPAAEAMLQRGDGLAVKQGRLVAQGRADNERLQRALREGRLQGGGVVVGKRKALKSGSLLVGRRPPKEPLRLVIMPAPNEGLMPGGEAGALVFVYDPDAKPATREQVLQGMFGLTPAEARLAQLLVSGSDVTESAAQLHITRASARFVLQRVFQKTGVNSQSALVRLGLGLPGARS